MKEKVNVTGVPETMVQTLYARAKETKKQNAKIKDEIAVKLVEKLDYDFSNFPVFEGFNHMQYQIQNPKGFARMPEKIIETDRLPELVF